MPTFLLFSWESLSQGLSRQLPCESTRISQFPSRVLQRNGLCYKFLAPLLACVVHMDGCSDLH